ncbi:hypothetical protein P879_11885 [Paragonimus westermani]|uniref:Uncharacterized protein n=1 Tax=Paragonimus westermani TaxID=34504 RepID=A0A8T0D644_9TREM|nr:hypothetical protein P879_11885 [Paragonimus westermani]
MGDLKLLDQPINSICDQMKIHSRSETTSNCSTQGGTSPAESMVGQIIHTRFDNIGPSPLTSTNEEVHSTSYTQCFRRFNIGDSVLARDFRGQDKWTPAVISRRKGKVIYEVTVGKSPGEDTSTSYGETRAYFRANQTQHHYIGTFYWTP